MSDNFIPIVSTTPPPLDDYNEEEFHGFTDVGGNWNVDDDFGAFSEPHPITDTWKPVKNSSLGFSDDQTAPAQNTINLPTSLHQDPQTSVNPIISSLYVDDNRNGISSNKVVNNNVDFRLVDAVPLDNEEDKAAFNVEENLNADTAVIKFRDDENRSDVDQNEITDSCSNNSVSPRKSRSPTPTDNSPSSHRSRDSSPTNSNSLSPRRSRNPSPLDYQKHPIEISPKNISPALRDDQDKPDCDFTEKLSMEEYDSTEVSVPPKKNLLRTNEDGTVDKYFDCSEEKTDVNIVPKALPETLPNFDTNVARVVEDDFAQFDDFQGVFDTNRSEFSKNSDPTFETCDKPSASTDLHTCEQTLIAKTDSTKGCRDDFADFAAFQHPPFPADEDSFQSPASKPQEDFAAFDDDNFVAFQTTTSTTDDDDDFGDFGQFNTAASFTEPQAPSQRTFSPTQEIAKVSTLLPIPDSSEYPDEEIHDIREHLKRDLLTLFMNSDSNTDEADQLTCRPSKLWRLLEDVDNAVALKFLWNSSTNQRELMKSLGISTQNMGLLQPNADQGNLQQVSNGYNTTDTQVPETSVWSVNTVDASSGGAGVAGSIPVSITNAEASSFNFDILDQTMSKSRNQSSKGEGKMDLELLELAMKVDPESSATKKPDPLSKILASLKVSSKKPQEEEEELSDEAIEVLDRLPNLSYMRSRVLMFPLSQSATN